ncbi:pre-mRNA-splicing factor CWC22 homolog isoform X1 [Athalia rosae]|uniref:pre-mRNA-splicing factor CWC22 homolog isoform X1 n=1 Tax=Athalia rosae TaxID=37344 RepID=UPI002034161A|nr:pre-mRNA-splicing factor CWC22 homolog isoform X1 [Athalia rosae]XP_012260344.2 pre-mRNA-splicing factor CWC22 homolog isoform X1 [Athalia rosae]XP_020709382.2 pre-mRNA-splicing factor CWC22 homolog isoform X1 [Athalia rosae]
MSEKESDGSLPEKGSHAKTSDNEIEDKNQGRCSKRKIDDENHHADRDRRTNRSDSKYSRKNNGGRTSRDRDRHHDCDRDRNRGRDRRRPRSKNKDRVDRSSERYITHEESDNFFRRERERHSNQDAPLRRYWSTEKKNSDQYWNKYPTNKDERIGQRFYGGRHKERNESSDRAFEDKENNDKVPRRDKNDDTGNGKQERITPAEKRTVDLLTSRTGGAYIPPAKLRMMQAEITDKSGAAYQRISWEALKKSIHGYINKVNTSNIGLITRELLHENIVRGRGLLARSIIQAQAASPTFTPIYGALTAVINSKFPNIGELLLKRLVIQFKRGFRRNDKAQCISSATFIAHLINQRVAHEILALEILTLLVETPTDDSVEVAIAFLKECGMKLTEVSKKGIEAIFEMLRNILHEGQLDKRVQYMIEVMFQIRKDGFKDHEAVIEELDLVEEDDQFTHLVTLDEATDSQDILNVFKFDPDYIATEEKYKALSKEILDTDSSGSEGSGNEEEDSSDEEGSNAAGEFSAKIHKLGESKEDVIVDNTETNLTALRRTIYLTIHSSLDFEECAHKLMKMQLKPGQEIELCHMFLDCCAEMRTYEKFFGLLAGRFCSINKIYVTPFEQIFKDSYDTIHRLDTNKLRNVSKFFAHLLFTDSISWEVLSCIKLNEEDTTSSSRIFIKILFQELSEYMGLSKLNQRVKDVTLQGAFEGLFPRDDPKNTRFAINFFTSIGLGGLTDELREHLKSRPKPAVVPQFVEVKEESSSSSSSSTSSSESSSSESSSESSDSSDSDDNRKKKNVKGKGKKKKKDKFSKPQKKVKQKGQVVKDIWDIDTEKGRVSNAREKNERHKDTNRKPEDGKYQSKKSDSIRRHESHRSRQGESDDRDQEGVQKEKNNKHRRHEDR